MDLSPLSRALDDLEHAVAGVADKLAAAVATDVTQSDVDQLVARVGGLAERLVGLNTPATQTSQSAPAAPVPVTPDAAANSIQAWKPAG